MSMNRLWPFLGQFDGGVALAVEYDPVWLRCLEEVTEVIQGLADEGRLPNIAAASVVMLEVPLADRFFGSKGTDQQLAYPGVIVWPWNQEANAPATNERDEIIYPVAVSFVEKGAGVVGNDAMIANRAAIRRHMLWRERISRRFRRASWRGISEIRESDVRPQVYAHPEAYRNRDLYHGATIIDFAAWETRDEE